MPKCPADVTRWSKRTSGYTALENIKTILFFDVEMGECGEYIINYMNRINVILNNRNVKENDLKSLQNIVFPFV